MARLIKSKKKNGITVWSMTESYMPWWFESQITFRLRQEATRLLIQARPDCWNGNAVKPFAEEEFLKIISELEDKKAAHVLVAKNIAARHNAQLAMVNNQIDELESLIESIDTEIQNISNTVE